MPVTGDQHVGAGPGHERRRVHLDAAVDLDVERRARASPPDRRRPLDLPQLLGLEGLPAEPGLDVMINSRSMRSSR
jgi:hypothetical protein